MPTQSLDAHLEKYLSVNTSIRQVRTLDHYRRSLRQYGEFLGHAPRSGDLTDDQLSEFLLATVRTGLSAATANQRVKQLRALWTWLAKRRLVECFPTFKDLREPEPMPQSWSLDELHLLFTGCARQTGYIGPHLAKTWWLAIHWWLFATAERTEATMLLERTMVNVDKRVARVPARIRKGRLKNQTYAMPDRCCELFEQMFLVPTETGLVFDNHWKDWRSIFGRYRAMIKDCGLPYVRGKSGPKKMRITVYSMIEASGGDASKFARHSDRRVTEHYIDQSLIAAHRAGQWPPKGLDPESRPRSWRNGWGILGA